MGIWGAAIAGAIALVALVSLFLNEDYRPGVYGTLVYFVIGIIYFAVRGRHKLVLSPEEEFAMSHGQHGANLQEEGYGTVSVTEISVTRHPRRRDNRRLGHHSRDRRGGLPPNPPRIPRLSKPLPLTLLQRQP